MKLLYIPVVVSSFIIIVEYIRKREKTKRTDKNRRELKRAMEKLEERLDNLETIIKSRRYREGRIWQ